MNPASKPAEESDIEHLMRHLRLSYWKVLNHLDEELERSGLTTRQLLFLRTLAEKGPCNSRTVCEALHVTPADVTGLADRLQARRFIKRIRGRGDRRQVILEMTDKGRAALQTGSRLRRDLVTWIFADLTPRELKVTLKSLGKVVDRLDREAPKSKNGRKVAANPEA